MGYDWLGQDEMLFSTTFKRADGHYDPCLACLIFKSTLA